MRFAAVAAAVFGFASFAVAAPLEKRGNGQATCAFGLCRRSLMLSGYTQGGNPGACGWYSSDSDYVVALDTSAYNGGSHCGSMVTLKVRLALARL